MSFRYAKMVTGQKKGHQEWAYHLSHIPKDKICITAVPSRRGNGKRGGGGRASSRRAMGWRQGRNGGVKPSPSALRE